MAIDYLLPKLAMSMNEGTINQWLVKQGDKIDKGQAILELETDKVVQEVESPAAGYFHIIAEEGETLKVNALIAKICESQEEVASLQASGLSDAPDNTEPDKQNDLPDEKTSEANAHFENANPNVEEVIFSPRSSKRIVASPLAKKIARDNQINLALLQGTGPQGRIIKQDVIKAMTAPAVMTSSAANRVSDTPAAERARLPMTGMRKAIATNMKASLQDAAQASSLWETDITDLLAIRGKLVEREEQLGTRVSVNAFIVKAIAYGIQQVPLVNACLQDEELVIYNTINIGIAVSVPGTTDYDRGLLVPVLNNIDTMGLVDIDLAMKELIHRARTNALTPDELTGSTITMSSTAGLAPPGCHSTPILNRPNAVIINPSSPIEKPVVYQGEIVPRTMMPMSLTFDHCLIDGDPAVRFAKAVDDCLKNPELLLVQ